MNELYRYIVSAIELMATLLLVFGFAKTAYLFVMSEFSTARHTKRTIDFSALRVLLGSYILMGLDMFIVADLIHSLIEPTTMDLLMLGLIVLIRTTIGYFLSREISDIAPLKSLEHE